MAYTDGNWYSGVRALRVSISTLIFILGRYHRRCFEPFGTSLYLALKLPRIFGFSLAIIYHYVPQSIWEEFDSSCCVCHISSFSTHTISTTEQLGLGQSRILLDFSVPATDSAYQDHHNVSRETCYDYI